MISRGVAAAILAIACVPWAWLLLSQAITIYVLLVLLSEGDLGACVDNAALPTLAMVWLAVAPHLLGILAALTADGLGPDKNQIVPRDLTQHLTAPTSLVQDAHRAGLLVHPYTHRPENNFLPADFQQGNPSSPVFLGARGNQPAELKLFYRLGVDGLFADNPDTAVAVRRKVFR